MLQRWIDHLRKVRIGAIRGDHSGGA
jgi:hypothetical protein